MVNKAVEKKKDTKYNKSMLLLSRLLDLSALRQGKAISLAPCIVTCVTCTGGILNEEHIASPSSFHSNISSANDCLKKKNVIFKQK